MTDHVPSHPSIQPTVLVAEDEGLIAMDLKRRLEILGWSVPATATTADEAVNMARLHVPDLILMDIRLKGVRDGIDAAREIRSSLDIPVIFVTSHGDTRTIDRARTANPFGYIVKPFNSSDLGAQIELARHRHNIERRLKGREAWLRNALETISEGVIVVDSSGTVDYLNPAAQQLTGWSLADASGQPVETVFRADGMDWLPQMTNEQVFRRRELLLYPREGNPVPIEATISARTCGEPQASRMITFRDVKPGCRHLDPPCDTVKETLPSRISVARQEPSREDYDGLLKAG